MYFLNSWTEDRDPVSGSATPLSWNMENPLAQYGQFIFLLRIFPELSSHLYSLDYKWRGSAWGWPQCTSLMLLKQSVSYGSQQNWGTLLGLCYKIRRQWRGEMHRWKRPCISSELWRKHVCRRLSWSKSKGLHWGKQLPIEQGQDESSGDLGSCLSRWVGPVG